MSSQAIEKEKILVSTLGKMESLLLAFSGGVDSTYLLKKAQQTLGEKVLAVTASSETYPTRELEEAKKLATIIGAKQHIIYTKELEIENFAGNPPDRCYYCKSELFGKLKDIAREKGFKHVADGANFDDTGDFRPGIKAARELQVHSPLLEAGLTKDEVRYLSKKEGLPTWNKPAFACLSSRFPYGQKITEEKLKQVSQGEDFLKSLGFNQLRVRHHDTIVRIEVESAEIEKIIINKEEILKFFKNLGFKYVSLDLEGYRQGSMNEVF